MLQHLIASLTMVVSLTTACGILMHDTNMDKAVLSAVQQVKDYTAADAGESVKPTSHPHTHSEGPSLSNTLKEGRAHPRRTPRYTDRKQARNRDAQRFGDDGINGRRLMLEALPSLR